MKQEQTSQFVPNNKKTKVNQILCLADFTNNDMTIQKTIFIKRIER